MKMMSKILLLLSITVLMVGCKLAVIVVEGGEVRSTSSGTCLGGTICIVDVASPDFYENFEAVPNEGWYFRRWNSGDRFLCGGSRKPICELSFNGYEESKEVADMVASSDVFYLMPVFTLAQPVSASDTVTVNGRVWAQPDLFLNLSWDDINAVCPGGVCGSDAILNGWNMSGWTWASDGDLCELFDSYLRIIGAWYSTCSLIHEPVPRQTTEIFNAIFERDGWRPTQGRPLPFTSVGIFGWSSLGPIDSPGDSVHQMCPYSYMSIVFPPIDWPPEFKYEYMDFYHLGNQCQYKDADTGAWFYK